MTRHVGLTRDRRQVDRLAERSLTVDQTDSDPQRCDGGVKIEDEVVENPETSSVGIIKTHLGRMAPPELTGEKIFANCSNFTEYLQCKRLTTWNRTESFPWFVTEQWVAVMSAGEA